MQPIWRSVTTAGTIRAKRTTRGSLSDASEVQYDLTQVQPGDDHVYGGSDTKGCSPA
jgi:hypothetical protein